MPREPTRRLRAVLKWGAYALYLGVFAIAFFHLLFLRPMLAELRRTQRPEAQDPPRYVSAEDLRQIGSLRTDRRSSFVHFERDKPAGVVRLCAFGDSFTFGDEVGDAHDFPSLLQDRLEQLGMGNAQVINFGSSWHGFHQSHLIWQRIGRGFDCDVLLLGPASFQPERDTVFNHSALTAPYYLHARYVLSGAGVELIEVVGDTLDERFDAYWALLPDFRYLRYDRNPPPLLRAALGRDRTIDNPFYYSELDPTQEALATYAQLVGSMADSGALVVWLHRMQPMLEFASKLGLPNLACAPALTNLGFPYFARRGHNSAWGNALLAQQLAAYLVEGVPRQFELVRARDVTWPDGGASTPVPLSELATLSVHLGDRALGVFTTTGTHDDTSGVGEADSLHGGPFSALLALDTDDSALISGAFVPLRFALRDGAPVELRADGGAKRSLGNVRLLGGRLPVGRIALPATRFHMKGELYVDTKQALPDASASTLELLVDGRVVLRGAAVDGRAKLLPPGQDMLRRIAPLAGVYTRAADLEPGGELVLVGEHARLGELRTPLSRLELREFGLPPPDRELPRVIAIGADAVGRLQPRAPAGASATPELP